MGEPRFSVCVYSVGSVRFLAGGVLEMEARSELVLQVALGIFGGGARCSFTAEHLLPRARGPRWPSCAFIPALELDAAAPDRDLEATGVQARQRCGRRSRMEALRSSRTDDFPSARGHLLIQGSCEDAAAARHRNVLFLVGSSALQGDLVVICIFVEVLSLKSLL